MLARVLGPDGWAGYFVAQSLLLILLAATTLGVEHGIAYYVGSGRWGARTAYGSALQVAAVMGCVGATVGVAARILVPSAFAGLSVGLTVVVVFGLPFALASLYAAYVAVASDRYELSMSLPAIQALLLLVLAVVGALVFELEGAVVGASLATVLAGVGAALWGRWSLPARRPPSPDSCAAPFPSGSRPMRRARFA